MDRSGYTEFDGGCPSDHRALWLDVSSASMLGIRPPRLLKPVSQRLHSSDPRLWRKYCTTVTAEYEKHLIPDKTRCLNIMAQEYTQSPGTPLHPILDLYQDIHSSTRAIRQATAKKIRKIRRGEVPWSPRLQHLRDQIELWTRVVKFHEGRPTSRTIIRRLAQRCGKIQEVTSFCREEAIEALRQSHRIYKQQKPDSLLWRHEHLHGLSDALAAQNDTSRAQEIRKMLTVEHQRRQGRAARRLRGKTPNQPVTKVTYHTLSGEVVEACDPASIVSAYAQSNLHRQHRCLSTPFFQTPY